jgi:hypothetical protein
VLVVRRSAQGAGQERTTSAGGTVKSLNVLAAIAITSLAAMGCSSPTDNGEDQDRDPRTTSLFALYSLPGGLVSVGTDSPYLWEGQDGARFYISGGILQCVSFPNANAIFNWWVFEPDLMQERTSGKKSAVGDGLPTCELVGADSLRFRFPQTGEVLTGRVWEDQGCWSLTIRLPSEKTIRGWVTTQGSDIPAYVSLPDPMPIATFRHSFCLDGP